VRSELQLGVFAWKATSGKETWTSNARLEEARRAGIQSNSCYSLCLMYMICQRFGWSMLGYS